MTGRSAIVTGSTSGIGLGIAETLARSGVNVMLNGIAKQSELERMAEDLSRRFGVSIAHSDADVSDPKEVDMMVEAAYDQFGSVDILVNNAGIQHTSPVESFELAQWDRIIAVNLSSNFHTIRAALPLMRKRGWGRIINIASVHGLVASAQKSAYVASKHGVIGLTKVVALETASEPITCNAICPGWVLTPLVEKQVQALADRDKLDEMSAQERLLAEKQPSGRFVTPAQIGAAVMFLCTDAAAEMRGVALPIDGGWTAQ